MGVTIEAEAVQLTDEQEVWQVVRAMNEAWTKQRGANLKRYFHPRMVAITATDRRRLVGREACVASWEAFAENANIHTWSEIEPRIDLFGETAIVTYYYELDFDLQGQRYVVKGRDMLTLVRENDHWWVVADHFSALPM